MESLYLGMDYQKEEFLQLANEKNTLGLEIATFWGFPKKPKQMQCKRDRGKCLNGTPPDRRWLASCVWTPCIPNSASWSLKEDWIFENVCEIFQKKKRFYSRSTRKKFWGSKSCILIVLQSKTPKKEEFLQLVNRKKVLRSNCNILGSPRKKQPKEEKRRVFSADRTEKKVFKDTKTKKFHPPKQVRLV